MTEPESDRRDVDAFGLEKHRIGVSEDVRGDALGWERRAGSRGLVATAACHGGLARPAAARGTPARCTRNERSSSAPSRARPVGRMTLCCCARLHCPRPWRFGPLISATALLGVTARQPRRVSRDATRLGSGALAAVACTAGRMQADQDQVRALPRGAVVAYPEQGVTIGLRSVRAVREAAASSLKTPSAAIAALRWSRSAQLAFELECPSRCSRPLRRDFLWFRAYGPASLTRRGS